MNYRDKIAQRQRFFCPCFLIPLMRAGTRQEGQTSGIAPASLHTVTYPSPGGEVPSRAVGNSPRSCQIAPTSSVGNPASLSLITHSCIAQHLSKTSTLWYHGLFFKNIMSWTYISLLSIPLVQECRKGTSKTLSLEPNLLFSFVFTSSSRCYSRSGACPGRSEVYSTQ